MEYKIVNLEEKIIVGVQANTSSIDEEMGNKIGEVWQKLFEGGVYDSIKNKANEYAIGLYSDYEGDSFNITAGVEVTSPGNDGVTTKIIPAGKSAKFSVTGPMMQVVADAWGEIWKMELDRSYTADSEEYLNSDEDNSKVNIYIALK